MIFFFFSLLPITILQSKIHYGISNIQRSPLTGSCRQGTACQPPLPIPKTGEISVLQRRKRSKYRHNSRSPDKMRLTVCAWQWRKRSPSLTLSYFSIYSIVIPIVQILTSISFRSKHVDCHSKPYKADSRHLIARSNDIKKIW